MSQFPKFDFKEDIKIGMCASRLYSSLCSVFVYLLKFYPLLKQFYHNVEGQLHICLFNNLLIFCSLFFKFFLKMELVFPLVLKYVMTSETKDKGCIYKFIIIVLPRLLSCSNIAVKCNKL